MSNPVKVLHTGDFHLGTEFRGLGSKGRQRKGELRRTFLDMIALCRKEAVELLLVAGDLFESWTVEDSLIQLVAEEFASLSDTQIVLVAGNHDPLTPEAAYLEPQRWSDNVHVLPPTFSSLLLEDLEVEIWGASFDAPYQTQSLLEPVSPQRPDWLQVGLLHGDLEQPQSDYHPITTQQIAESGLDYLALGHIHKPSNPTSAGGTVYAYAGNPEGRGFDELGPRGVLLGTLEKNHIQMDFVPLSQRMYLEHEVDISAAEGSRHGAALVLESVQQAYGEDCREQLYKILLTGAVDDEKNLRFDTLLDDLHPLYYAKLRDHTHVSIDVEKVALEPSLKGIFVRKLAEKSADAEEKDTALKLGLKAFWGEVEYHED